MHLDSDSFADNGPIPAEFAFGKPDPQAHMALSDNRSPHLRWSGAPAGTKSYAILCTDVEVPTVFDDANQEGRTIPRDLARMDFHHWALVDVPADMMELPAGADSDGVTPKGKPPGPTPHGRRGINDYTRFNAGNPDMAGDYGGYDGPCPPWNDERMHRYVFTVYALDVEQLDVPDRFTVPDALKAMEGHVLDKSSRTGLYTLNPGVKG